jgi:hypothetical protein
MSAPPVSTVPPSRRDYGWKNGKPGKCFAALLFLLATDPAFAAASRVWITEFSVARVEAAAPFASLPSAVKQTPLDITSSAKSSAPFSPQTRYIRVVCEVQCAISATGTATINDIMLPALRPEYFGVLPGKTLSVIAAP